ncbi:hypothetical protein KY285_024133 [Solanum tuberosum]|nr:hypothetical protein KY289_024475 [Solanum tuberosum]KAH0676332.1 hypothetical protein KY285_024133 [Solanum tuberosum]
MLFHKIALELGVENVETFGCRVNKKGPVGINASFEDIYKERRGRFEGNLGGDDPYFDSSGPGSDISEDEGDPVENDEVVDLAPRKETTKIYFDPTAKKIFGHNKKGCPTLKNAAARTSAATAESQSSVNAGPSAGYTPSAGLISARRPINDSSSGVRLATTLTSGGRPTSATSSDVRQLSTQQSTSSAAGQKRKTSTTLRVGSVTERSGNTDRVLHSATLSSLTPTNIDLGYKLNGLRWKGRAAITQRQLREESNRST